eukprot:6184015-Pleurochrysis_carterae.AAC.1
MSIQSYIKLRVLFFIELFGASSFSRCAPTAAALPDALPLSVRRDLGEPLPAPPLVQPPCAIALLLLPLLRAATPPA